MRGRDAQPIDPVVVHRAKDGTYRYPGSADAPVPSGYERIELRTLAEVDRFTKTVNQHERELIDQHVIHEEVLLQMNEARNRSDLRMAMQSMTPAQRAFARIAIERNNAHRPRAYDPGFHLEVREMDASNREAHRDVRTGWKPRR